MIFAHGPAGFLSAAALKKYWKKVRPRQRVFLLGLGFFAGILPDIDLFFFYNVSAEQSHREYFTHAPLFWVTVGFLIYVIGKTTRKKIIAWSGIVLGIGTLSHIVFDSVVGQTVWLWPFSDHLYGLTRIPWIPKLFLHNLFFINYFIETTFVTGFLLVLIRRFMKKKHQRRNMYVGAGVLGIVALCLVFWMNLHVVQLNPEIYFGDSDKDQIVNGDDQDFDGDGLENIFDPDANGNDISNEEEIVIIAERLRGSWYNPLPGNFEITRRFGVVENRVLPKYLFDQIGVYIEQEMKKDYENHPETYKAGPASLDFSWRNDHLETLMKNTDQLLGPVTTPKVGDLIFLEVEEELFVGIAVTADPIGILYADPAHPTSLYAFESIKDLGEITGIGRVLRGPL